VACKPAIGHTLGASGLVELAAAMHDPAAHRIWKLGMGFGGHLACVAVARE
jgi:3-oxoacyl-(acyl-carrier-protein) synthase